MSYFVWVVFLEGGGGFEVLAARMTEMRRETSFKLIQNSCFLILMSRYGVDGQDARSVASHNSENPCYGKSDAKRCEEFVDDVTSEVDLLHIIHQRTTT